MPFSCAKTSVVRQDKLAHQNRVPEHAQAPYCKCKSKVSGWDDTEQRPVASLRVKPDTRDTTPGEWYHDAGNCDHLSVSLCRPGSSPRQSCPTVSVHTRLFCSLPFLPPSAPLLFYRAASSASAFSSSNCVLFLHRLIFCSSSLVFVLLPSSCSPFSSNMSYHPTCSVSLSSPRFSLALRLLVSFALQPLPSPSRQNHSSCHRHGHTPKGPKTRFDTLCACMRATGVKGNLTKCARLCLQETPSSFPKKLGANKSSSPDGLSERPRAQLATRKWARRKVCF